jgi:transposase
MMGQRQIDQAALFYEFSLERHVPVSHLLRSIDRFVDLSDIRRHLEPFYSCTGRPSIDPELLVRMLLVGYCYGIRSERRLCEEVHLNLAYRWFCRLGLEGEVPDHSTFSKNRHGRFRDCDLLRKLFETVVQRCIAEGLVDGVAFAVDASLIAADANKQRALLELMRLTGGPLRGRADPSGSISIRWMKRPGARRATQYRSSLPRRTQPRNGPALTKDMPSLPTPTTI